MTRTPWFFAEPRSARGLDQRDVRKLRVDHWVTEVGTCMDDADKALEACRWEAAAGLLESAASAARFAGIESQGIVALHDDGTPS